MPIEFYEPKRRMMLHFGAGDIHITDATARPEDGGGSLVIFHQMEPRPIGASAPELHGTPCDDFAVGMTFSKPESIDAIIDVLEQFKRDHFRTALTAAEANSIPSALKTIGITADTLFARIQEDLGRGLLNEARAHLNFVDGLTAEADARQCDDTRRLDWCDQSSNDAIESIVREHVHNHKVKTFRQAIDAAMRKDKL